MIPSTHFFRTHLHPTCLYSYVHLLQMNPLRKHKTWRDVLNRAINTFPVDGNDSKGQALILGCRFMALDHSFEMAIPQGTFQVHELALIYPHLAKKLSFIAHGYIPLPVLGPFITAIDAWNVDVWLLNVTPDRKPYTPPPQAFMGGVSRSNHARFAKGAMG